MLNDEGEDCKLMCEYRATLETKWRYKPTTLLCQN